VLQDEVQKYLLADEVGLGKTIEAGLIIREHVLRDEGSAEVLISVPEGLVVQWQDELSTRFYLEDLLGEKIRICDHNSLSGQLDNGSPTLIVIDEAHNLSPWAWSIIEERRSDYQKIAHCMSQIDKCLLLSGTPLSGNEENFLAMLHLVSPERYSLDEEGKRDFVTRLSERQRLGGMYQALVPGNDNDTLSEILHEILKLFPSDGELLRLASVAEPLIEWTASEEGDERNDAVLALRTHIGENYRLHQRLLRNRRSDPLIAGLFPGLAGAKVTSWPIDERSLSIDQVLDAYRDERCVSGETSTIGGVALTEWMEAYMTSPILVSDRARALLEAQDGTIDDGEVTLLQELLRCGDAEQYTKDQLLRFGIRELLVQSTRKKIVIFCGEQTLADRVFQLLAEDAAENVERHNPGMPLTFCSDSKVRVLVCDERGEDGVNLHGGEKHLVHYSVPRSFSRIEQRNGRANRYSAAIFARPVTSTVLIPNRRSLFSTWVEILRDVVGIFDKSVASLQYVLQDQFDAAWKEVEVNGLQPLHLLKAALAGPTGILETERQKVRAQEELNSMNEEVELAVTFAKELQAADEIAEAQAERMFSWIQEALHFGRKPGSVAGSFRFKYNNDRSRGPRTLVDVASFVSNCETGIDKEHSNWSEPVTSLMSPDRQLVSHGHRVYPMRYGQPFIDTIFEMLATDSRGICAAKIRAVQGRAPTEPELYFHLFWTSSAREQGIHPQQQRRADERCPPAVHAHWLDATGREVKDESLRELLEARYSKKPTQSANGIAYQDININSTVWPALEEYFPMRGWAELVQRLGEEALRIQLEEHRDSSRAFSLEAISAVVIIGS
jgi:ATP-dependent helicase HepA